MSYTIPYLIIYTESVCITLSGKEKPYIFKKEGFWGFLFFLKSLSAHDITTFPSVCLIFLFRQNWKATWIFLTDCSILRTGIVHVTTFLEVKARKASSLLLLVKIKLSALWRSHCKHLPCHWRQACLAPWTEFPSSLAGDRPWLL